MQKPRKNELKQHTEAYRKNIKMLRITKERLLISSLLLISFKF